MKKRMLSLILAVMLLAATFVPFAVAEDDSLPASAGYYYVYTENGKGLNVRNNPGGTVVGTLKYGTRIYCYYNEDGWALIDFKYDMPGYGLGTYACFVSSRYLVKNKPAAKPAKKESTTKQETAKTTDPLAELNAEFASAKRVEPYKITVRPTRASGWVNMRWAPSKSAELLATYKANDTLLVIQELANWLQVEDQDTGDVGFIDKSFVAQ